MSNDFVYDMSEINEEEIVKGWEEMVAEDGSIWETGYGDEADYIPGLDDGEGYDPIMGDDDEWIDTDDEWLDDFAGEEDFA
jgi:hypothetical protein